MNTILKAALIAGYTVTGMVQPQAAEAKPLTVQLNQLCDGDPVRFYFDHEKSGMAAVLRQNNGQAVMTSSDCRRLLSGEAVQYVNPQLATLAHDWRDGKAPISHAHNKLFTGMWHMAQMARQIARGSTIQVRLVSTHRSLATQKKLEKGNAKTSQHYAGAAADFKLEGIPLTTTYCLARAFRTTVYDGKGGLGYYPQKHNDMIHFDLRNYNANWGPIFSCTRNNEIKINTGNTITAALRNMKASRAVLLASVAPESVPRPQARPTGIIDVADIPRPTPKPDNLPLTPNERIAIAWGNTSKDALSAIEQRMMVGETPQPVQTLLSYNFNYNGRHIHIDLPKPSQPDLSERKKIESTDPRRRAGKTSRLHLTATLVQR